MTKGSMLVLFIPALAGLFVLTLFIVRWERAEWAAGKARVVAEETLLSSLRVKVEGLAGLAGKWELLRPLCGPAFSAGVRVDSSHWDNVIQMSAGLKNSIPGYKGRIKSVATVVSEANGIRKGALSSSGEALDLGVVSKGQWLADPSGLQVWADGFWVQRAWSASSRLGEPDGTAVHEVVLTDPYFGPVVGRAQARVRWDVSTESPFIRTTGNGGFPRNWEEAVQDGRVDPFRYPFFRTETVSLKRASHE